ncbi:MAG: YggS family pyridoxal phosphate-dependent enzyme [Syntrophobacterales bacterium]|nr:YggS family pyridoxal phosphate-dependent enzyme [Syntrophobacterales bacterium]
MSDIARRLADIRERMAAAARRAGRDPAAVRLVAVSKSVGLEALREAVAAGQRLIGENYLQEAKDKIAALGPEVEWHFIGHLQSNKAKAAVGRFALIHSLDRLGLAEALETAAARQNRVQEVLVQVKVGGEASKSGVAPEAAADLLRELSRFPHLRVVGLMTLPPFLPDPEAVRPYFRALRELRDRLVAQGLADTGLPELSMGMSGDFEVAVEEGATLIRVGTALFGPRPAR